MYELLPFVRGQIGASKCIALRQNRNKIISAKDVVALRHTYYHTLAKYTVTGFTPRTL